MAMHLVDPIFLHDWADDKAQMYEYCDEGDSTCVDAEDRPLHDLYRAICYIADYMTSGVKFSLFCAIDFIEENANQQIIKIAKVLQYGAGRYAPNNWRLIPEEEHINHALIHLMAALEGDIQDDHLDHALCRLMMAISTEKSPNFEYGKYVDEVSV